ncbi:MAG: 5'/3'-nucleotidase SurE [Acidobacteria bacterium RIFCSPLOWO2_12_FULL_54_10]|nr:MAG: 5'/3'-nucleotidase SurE [Acidobacteria bacterium RIFCSPLOWO2_12_FULL_54_10]
MSESLPRILVTNDDGIESEGIHILAEALSAVGRVTIAAPSEEKSASSHSISLFRPLSYKQVGPDRYAIHGTPVDAVIVAISHLLEEKPALVISGINKGNNLGLNVFYSGTVAAAVEGTLHGIPSMAVSICSKNSFPFERVAAFAAQLAAGVLKEGLPGGVTLNVNVPPNWHNGVRVTQRSPRHARQLVIERNGSPDEDTYWIREHLDESKFPSDSDHAAVRAGHASITPLRFDTSDETALDWLAEWVKSFSKSPVG